ncbi:MAG: RNA polymerase sigma factor [Bacteroidales bacterium]
MENGEGHIIQRAREGDQAAFAILVERYKNQAFSVALPIAGNREDAEEIAMDAFVKAWNALPSFKGEARFSTWLFRIVYNTAISFRRKKRLDTVPMDEKLVDNYSEDELSTGLQQLTTDEQIQLVKRVMKTLPPDDAALMELFYHQQLSIEEISQITLLSLSNVKVKLHRIRKRIYASIQTHLRASEIRIR